MADQPGYTRLPNDIIEAMPYLGNAELRVLLAIARKTIGFQKESDRISTSQIESMTGLAHRHALSALQSLVDRGFIAQEQIGKQSYKYSVKPVPLGNQSPTGTGTPREPEPVPLGNQLYEKPVPLGNTQKKDLKEKKEKGSERATRATPPTKQASLSSLSEPVQVYKELTGVKALAPVIADKITDTVIDLEHWREVITAWCGRYDKRNTDGMLDWYLHPDKMARKNGGANNGRRNTNIRQNPGGAFERAVWTFEGADESTLPT